VGYVAVDGRIIIVKSPEDRQPAWSETEEFSEDVERWDQSMYKRFEESRIARGIDVNAKVE
jgi:hypothetical protein